MNAKNSKREKRDAIVTGAFFISATTTAITGVLLYGPIMGPDFLIDGAKHSTQIIWGAIFELLLAVSNVGTGIMLYPKLRRFSESWGLGYVAFRMLEVVFIMVGILNVLGVLTLSHLYTSAATPDKTMFEALGQTLKGIHMYTFILGPKFMLGVNTFIYSTIFFQSKLVPRPLAILGITGAVLVFITAIFNLFEIVLPLSPAEIIMVLPVAVYEMVLAGWLIVKGFNKEVSFSNKNQSAFFPAANTNRKHGPGPKRSRRPATTTQVNNQNK